MGDCEPGGEPSVGPVAVVVVLWRHVVTPTRRLGAAAAAVMHTRQTPTLEQWRSTEVAELWQPVDASDEWIVSSTTSPRSSGLP